MKKTGAKRKEAPAPSNKGSFRTLTVKGKEYYYSFLCLRDCFDFTDEAHATLSHEVIHICSTTTGLV